MTPPWQRRIAWVLFGLLLGIALGLFATAVYDAWVRLGAGAYGRSTLFHVLGFLALGLAASWAAAAARTRAIQGAPPRRSEPETVWVPARSG